MPGNARPRPVTRPQPVPPSCGILLVTAWTERLGKEMHEVAVETSSFELELVCHDLHVQQLGSATLSQKY
jgi:hypothetical protein